MQSIKIYPIVMQIEKFKTMINLLTKDFIMRVVKVIERWGLSPYEYIPQNGNEIIEAESMTIIPIVLKSAKKIIAKLGNDIYVSVNRKFSGMDRKMKTNFKTADTQKNSIISSFKGKIKRYLNKYFGYLMAEINTNWKVGISKGWSIEETIRVLKIKLLDLLHSKRETVATTEIAHYTRVVGESKALEYGLTKGVWITRHDTFVRESHTVRDGEEFDIQKGCYHAIDKRFIKTGEEINCRCGMGILWQRV